jgi:hypothetical protein
MNSAVKIMMLVSMARQQPENWENRNDPDLVQEFPKKYDIKTIYSSY